MRFSSTFVSLIFVAVAASTASAQTLPAFPGAEGAGSTATGGRGREIYHVTNLNQSGPGSFVDALQGSNRIVVFDVSGVISLNTPDSSAGRNDHWFRTGVSNITIAGQTAPGNGIVIEGTGTKFTGNNVVLRNISFRPGGTWKGQARTMDGLWIQAQNSVFDHVSSTWASDEGISTSDIADNTTVQYSIMAEGLMDHSYGGLIQVDTQNTVISYHHNLFTNNRARNPRLGNKTGAVNVTDFRNNVVYNPESAGGYSVSNEEGDGNFINNYYVAGPETSSSQAGYAFSSGNLTDIFQSGNKIDPNKDGVFNGTNTGWSMFTGPYRVSPTELAVPYVTTQTADDALDTVLDYSGANWWNRTSTDSRVVNDVRSAGTAGKFIYDPSEVGGWPTESIVYRPANWDTDLDGMPDDWENEHGLNPLVANNNGDFDADGYTDVEEYLNEVAAWPAPQPITFTAATNGRFAQITNWDIPWQPSKFDTAVINQGTVEVDAVGQHAGNLILGANNGDSPTLNITAGWIKVENATEGLSDGMTVIGDHAGATAMLNLSGGTLRTESLDKNAGSLFNFTGGVLSADTVHFDLVNDGGAIAPGESIGVMSVLGDLDLNAGALAIELASPTAADQVHVTGVFTLGGDLTVSLLDGFDPQTGSWVIATAATYEGSFDSVTPGYAVVQQGNDLLLSVAPELPGDYNGDGAVNLADYTMWRDNLGAPAGTLVNDIDGGTIGPAQYATWKANFGANSASAASQNATVPEPGGWVLLILGGVLAMFHRNPCKRLRRPARSVPAAVSQIEAAT